MSPTIRHRRDVSSKPSCPGVKPLRSVYDIWAQTFGCETFECKTFGRRRLGARHLGARHLGADVWVRDIWARNALLYNSEDFAMIIVVLCSKEQTKVLLMYRLIGIGIGDRSKMSVITDPIPIFLKPI